MSTFNRKQKTDWYLQQKTENIEYLQQKKKTDWIHCTYNRKQIEYFQQKT